MKNLLLATLLLFVPLSVHAGPSHQNGSISNLTVTTGGIMIKLSSGLPDNCAGTPPWSWMLIKQEHTAITSVVLASWASGNKTGTVYTSGRENGSGYCLVTQFDPTN